MKCYLKCLNNCYLYIILRTLYQDNTRLYLSLMEIEVDKYILSATQEMCLLLHFM